MTDKEIKTALNNLVKDGAIWANCPKCTITLSHKEYAKRTCDTCGQFDLEKVVFYPKTNEC